MVTSREPVIGIDILRLFAALMVACYHLGFRAWSDVGYFLERLLGVRAELHDWSFLTWFGWIGVQLFFVISGFVIAFSSEHSTPLRFIRSRILRLVPAMWIAVVVCLAVALTWPIPADRTAYLAAKMAVFAPIGPWLAGQVWTLPIEIAFYGLVLILLMRRGFNQMENLAIALAGLSVVYWTGITFGVHDTAGRTTQLLLLQHGCYFALGIGLWLLHRYGMTWKRLAIVAVCIAVARLQLDSALIGESPDFGYVEHGGEVFLIWLMAVALLASSIYFNSALLRLFPFSAAIRTIGVMTYPLYLLHYHVGGGSMVIAFDLGAAPGFAIIVGLLASCAAAYVSAVVLEPVVYRMLRPVIEALEQRLAGAYS